MAHDLIDRRGWFTAGPMARVESVHLGLEDPATGPSEVGASGTHPLVVSGVGGPLGWEPSEPHRLASPLTDEVHDGGVL